MDFFTMYLFGLFDDDHPREPIRDSEKKLDHARPTTPVSSGFGFILGALFIALLATAHYFAPLDLFSTKAFAGQKYRIAWSHYTGWEPWAYANQRFVEVDDQGRKVEKPSILEKWSKKYGIEIELTLVNDYVESVNLYTNGKFDGVAVTNMDALTIPAASGKDTTALIIGDFSNGNDGILMKNGRSVRDLRGREVKLVELSVSHFLLARCLEKNGMSERDLGKVVNTSDADIGAIFAADPNGAAVTWNPILMKVRNVRGAVMVCDSSQIPGEIIDMLVVRTDAPDALKKALVGAWFETMRVVSGRGSSAEKALKYMAEFSGSTLAEFKAQLRTTAMFYTPESAANFARDKKLKQTTEFVRSFSFEKGLFGKGAKSKDDVGIQFPDGSVMGNPANVKLRFDAKFMQMAAEGKLD